MKKRRELDALVNGKLGKSKTRKNKKGSGHELLHNESDSSDVEEFSLATQKTIVRHGPSRFCATCLPICGFFLLVACIVAVGGLVWVHIKLHSDLDHLRTQIRAVESGSKTNPDTFQQIHSKLKAVEDKVNRLRKDHTDHSTQLTTVKQELAKLQGTTTSLQERLKDSPALANLPKSVTDLSKNVADFGSEIKTLQANVNALLKFKTAEEKRVTTVEKQLHSLEASKHVSTTVAPPVSTAAPAINQFVQKHLEVLSHDLSVVNVTTNSQLVKLTSQILKQQAKLDGLKNTTDHLKVRIDLLGLSPSSNKLNMSDINTLITQAVTHVLQNASSPHQMAQQGTLTGLASQIQNITDLVIDNKQQFNQFKTDWSSGKLNHVNLNITAGFNKIVQNALKAYTAQTHPQIQSISESLSNLNNTVEDLQQSVHHQTVTLSTLLSSLTSVQKNQTTGGPRTSEQTNSVSAGNKSEVKRSDGSSVPSKPDKTEDLLHIDKNNDGFITREELRAYLGSHSTPEDVFNMYDKDHDGKLSYTEMRGAVGLHASSVLSPEEMPQENTGIIKSHSHPRRQGAVNDILGVLGKTP